MLAALSHDLRTPLTLLRLRTEGLQEAEERDRMLANIGELDAMIDATLKFARDEAAAEPWRRTDLTALVTSIVDDMADAGLPVTMDAGRTGHPGMPARGVAPRGHQPAGQRRQIWRSGAGRDLGVADATSGSSSMTKVPASPMPRLQKVFEPFYRLEQSRSRETGGTGLGLAIAQSIAQAHGGQVTLSNRPEGGLRAILSLPR